MSAGGSAVRTHHGREWGAADLLRRKEEAGLRVSVVLPARNEAATVGGLVARLRTALVEELPLVDELVVIDSDSTDATADVAAAAGARVHCAADVRPDLGSFPGKGEAVWKALLVTSGDLLVFLDADLLDWGPHFVPGLLGPLLTDPRVLLVKGFYDRPGRPGGSVDGVGVPAQEGEGGRVTELLARPALALLFPELADVVQPLAGEWAVRREHMLGLHVPTGYAVDLAALVDTVTAHGPDSVAQVDLGRRSHRRQELRDLGPMALQCLAALQTRAGLTHPETVPLRQFRATSEGTTATVRDIPLGQRPPAVSVLAADDRAGDRADDRAGDRR